MLRLLRNRRVKKMVVIFVVLTFLGGSVGAYALRSLGTDPEPRDPGDEYYQEYLAQLEFLGEEIAWYESQVEEDPADAAAWAVLGDLYYELAHFKAYYVNEDVTEELGNASRAYGKALELDGDRTGLLLSAGVVETWRGDYQAARPLFEEYIGIHPESFLGYATFSQMLQMAGQEEEARENYAMAVELAQTEEEKEVVGQLAPLFE